MSEERPNVRPWRLYCLGWSSAHWHGLVQLPFRACLSQYPTLESAKKKIGAKDPQTTCIKLSPAKANLPIYLIYLVNSYLFT